MIWGQVPSENPEHFYAISELDQLSISVRLNLSKQNFVREGSKCPQNFQWKGIIQLIRILLYTMTIVLLSLYIGSAGPPSSRYLSFYRFSLVGMIIIGLLSGLGLVNAVAWLIFNITWRSNKYVLPKPCGYTLSFHKESLWS